MTLVDLLLAAFTRDADVNGALIAIIAVEDLAAGALTSGALRALDARVAVNAGRSVDQDVRHATTRIGVTHALEAVARVLILAGDRSTAVGDAGSLVADVSTHTQVDALSVHAVFVSGAGPTDRRELGSRGRVRGGAATVIRVGAGGERDCKENDQSQS